MLDDRLEKGLRHGSEGSDFLPVNVSPNADGRDIIARTERLDGTAWLAVGGEEARHASRPHRPGHPDMPHHVGRQEFALRGHPP